MGGVYKTRVGYNLCIFTPIYMYTFSIEYAILTKRGYYKTFYEGEKKFLSLLLMFYMYILIKTVKDILTNIYLREDERGGVYTIYI